MDIIVQKYGGSSVATPELILNVAKRIIETKKETPNVVVVVSAMGKTTDGLITLAHNINPNPDNREMDMLLACGENISIALLSMAIGKLGEKSISLTGQQVGIITDKRHSGAKIVHINTNKIIQHLIEGKIVIVAGFQGITFENEITTLGRGGSDTSAVAIAAALNAKVCEILTDVNGVYTADPNLIKNARKINNVTYDEILEMAFLGAKVLHSRSVEIARRYKIPIHVRSSFENSPGTIIEEEAKMEKVLIRGITHNEKIIKISIVGVPDRPGIAAKVFRELGEKNIPVLLIVQAQGHNNVNDITFAAGSNDLNIIKSVIGPLSLEINAEEVIYNEDMATVSVIGEGISTSPGVPGKIFTILAGEGINLDVISTSTITITFMVEKKMVEKAVKALHTELIEGQEAFE